MTQCEKVLKHLEDHGSITSLEAIKEYGILRLASRISDLKKRGYKITSEIQSGKNRNQEDTHFSVYKLVKE